MSSHQVSSGTERICKHAQFLNFWSSYWHWNRNLHLYRTFKDLAHIGESGSYSFFWLIHVSLFVALRASIQLVLGGHGRGLLLLFFFLSLRQARTFSATLETKRLTDSPHRDVVPYKYQWWVVNLTFYSKIGTPTTKAFLTANELAYVL